MRKQYVCLPKSSQRPLAQKGPQERVPGVSTASVYMLFSPLPFSVIHAPSLCSTCCYRHFYLVLFFPVSFHCGFPKSIIFILYFVFSLSLLPLMNVDDIDFPTTELQLSQDYRLQGERERGFTFPENQHLSNSQCCDAWQPSKVSFFSYPQFTKRGSTANAACTCGFKPAKADFPHLLCGCGVLS